MWVLLGASCAASCGRVSSMCSLTANIDRCLELRDKSDLRIVEIVVVLPYLAKEPETKTESVS